MSGPVERLQERCPGISVDSDVQAHALLDEFQNGVVAFHELARPTAEDHRWLGVCFFSLFRDSDAIDTYGKAVEMGSQAARINLAHSLAFVDRADEIVAQLEQVNFGQLSLYDQVLYLRVKSLNDERNGQLHVALKQADHAWRLVQGTPEFPLLAPQLLNQLGILHARIGRAQRALWYLDRNLEISSGEERTRVRLTRVHVLNSLGRIKEARSEFRLLDAPDQHYGAVIHLRNAEISWAEGNLDRAMQEYRDAIERARELQQGYEEFQASLDLAVLTARVRDRNSQGLLARAQELISDRSDRLLFRFREILMAMWEGRYSVSHAAAEFSIVSASFSEMGLLQEQGWVDAHTAHTLYLAGEESKSQEIVDSLAALALTLQNPAFLIREWQLMPEFALEVQRTHLSLAMPGGSDHITQGERTTRQRGSVRIP